MKYQFSIVIFAIFTCNAFGKPQIISTIVTEKISFEQSVIVRQFMTDFINSFRVEVRKHFVFIIDGFDLNHIQVYDNWPFKSDLQKTAKYLELFEGRVFFSDGNVEKILQNIRWSTRTLFVVILPRDTTDNRFYMEDISHQKLNVAYLIKHSDVVKDFQKQILKNERRRRDAEFEIKSTLKKFWSERILNVIVAKPQKSRVYIYTYFPYTELNCAEVLVPVLTNVWFKKSSSFYANHTFFPEKTGNLYNCRINVTVVLNPPAIIRDGKGLSGIEGKILMELFSLLNATPHFTFVKHSNKSTAAMTSVLNDVRNGVSDIGAGFLVPTKAETGLTDCIYVSVNLCLTWAVPNRAKIKNYIAYIFETFTVTVWLQILLTVFVSAVFFWLLTKRSKIIECSFWQALTIISFTLLGEPSFPSRETPIITFLAFFTLFSVFLSEIFQAGLGSNNIIIQPRSQLDSIEDVIDSGLEIKGVDHAIELFDRLSIGKKANVEFGEIHNSLVQVGLERKVIYIGFKLPMKYYKNVMHPELRNLIHIHRSCLVTYQPFFALRKNSPFSERVNKWVTAMAENGYSDMLYQSFTKYESSINRKKKREEVDMILFYGSFYIWAFGMLLSFFTFLGECLHAKYKNRNNH